jgi:hypothetical protein
VYRHLLPVLAVLLVSPSADAQFTLEYSVIGGGATDATGGGYSLRGTIGQGIVGAVDGGGFVGGQGFWNVVGSTSGGGQSESLLLTLSVFLEGPYASGDMDVALSAMLPQSDPYLGTETVSGGFFTTDSLGLQTVDWVLVQLRTGVPSDPPMQVVAERAALLLADGRIADVGGAQVVTFAGLSPGSYYVTIVHRNHVAAMSDSAVDLRTGEGAHDFIRGAAYGTTPLKDLGRGTFGLIAGDADGNGTADNDDFLSHWLVQAGASGYLTADFDLDGNVFNNDLIRYWLTNLGRSTGVPPP